MRLRKAPKESHTYGEEGNCEPVVSSSPDLFVSFLAEEHETAVVPCVFEAIVFVIYTLHALNTLTPPYLRKSVNYEQNPHTILGDPIYVFRSDRPQSHKTKYLDASCSFFDI